MAKPCRFCGKPIPEDLDYCSRECFEKAVGKDYMVKLESETSSTVQGQAHRKGLMNVILELIPRLPPLSLDELTHYLSYLMGLTPYTVFYRYLRTLLVVGKIKTVNLDGKTVVAVNREAEKSG